MANRMSVVRLLKIGLCVVTLCIATFMLTAQTNSVRNLNIENSITYLYTTEDQGAECGHKVEDFIPAKNSSKPTPTEKTTPWIYVVTPSGGRLTQKAELTRMSYTLRLVPRLHWILIEDNVNRSAMVASLLKRSGLSHTHLNVPTPSVLVVRSNMSRVSRTRGLYQRNAGIHWLHKHGRPPAVVYFADDDNVYDIRLFEEMRSTKKVSIWPVAFSSGQRYESPKVQKGEVTGWLTSYPRPFSTDMAGFAINLKLFLDHRNVTFNNIKGRMESDLLAQFKLKLTDLEPKADNCTKILVWHTRTEKPWMAKDKNALKRFGNKTYINIEV